MTDWPRIRDLPVEERVLFAQWLYDQTRPWIAGLHEDSQDAYYEHDYKRWKAGLLD
jgi:hypothetical protein